MTAERAGRGWPIARRATRGHGSFPSHPVGAKAKDAVESDLSKGVCAGTLTLHEAQQLIATDWFRYDRDHVLK
jgi:hypothetical protein